MLPVPRADYRPRLAADAAQVKRRRRADSPRRCDSAEVQLTPTASISIVADMMLAPRVGRLLASGNILIGALPALLLWLCASLLGASSGRHRLTHRSQEVFKNGRQDNIRLIPRRARHGVIIGTCGRSQHHGIANSRHRHITCGPVAACRLSPIAERRVSVFSLQLTSRDIQSPIARDFDFFIGGAATHVDAHFSTGRPLAAGLCHSDAPASSAHRCCQRYIDTAAAPIARCAATDSRRCRTTKYTTQHRAALRGGYAC